MNGSKIRDPRQWEKWRKAGALGKTPRPRPKPISPWAHIADELAAAAREGNELSNRLLLEFGPTQGEAYECYCEREAQVQDKKEGQTKEEEASKQVSPWAHIADELAAAAREGNELRMKLLLEFMPVQAETYTAYCKREALFEQAEKKRRNRRKKRL